MSKHTPGQWIADDTGAIFGPDGRPIMTCGQYAIDHGEGTEEARDNAFLIASAPDLLDELKNIVNADYKGWQDGYNNAEEFVLWAKNRARMSIAKAEGK